MPHINIKFFPRELDDGQVRTLSSQITDTLKTVFLCQEEHISISLEPIEAHRWGDEVFVPEIEGRRHLLCKSPGYTMEDLKGGGE